MYKKKVWLVERKNLFW